MPVGGWPVAAPSTGTKFQVYVRHPPRGLTEISALDSVRRQAASRDAFPGPRRRDEVIPRLGDHEPPPSCGHPRQPRRVPVASGVIAPGARPSSPSPTALRPAAHRHAGAGGVVLLSRPPRRAGRRSPRWRPGGSSCSAFALLGLNLLFAGPPTVLALIIGLLPRARCSCAISSCTTPWW